MLIQRGFREKISKHFNPNQEIVLSIELQGSETYDFCCFGLDNNERLLNDSYMIFYNQLTSPENAMKMTLSENKAHVSIFLEKAPTTLDKFVFTINTDDTGSIKSINNGQIKLSQSDREVLSFPINGSEFDKEKAIIAIEVYRRNNEWRIAAIASGFNGGLADLLRLYGGEEATEEPQSEIAVATPSPPPIVPQSTQSEPPPRRQPITIPPPAPTPSIPSTPSVPLRISLQRDTVGGYLNRIKSGFSDIVGNSKHDDEIERLTVRINQLQSMLTPEVTDVINARKIFASLQTEIHALELKKSTLRQQIEMKEKEVIELDDKKLLQDFGLYEPQYQFLNSNDYKAQLQIIRQSQKDIIRNGQATTGNQGWRVDNSLAKGKKMVNDMQKLLLRAFNSECEEIIDRVKYNNYDSSLKRISTSFEAITKLGSMMQVSITIPYYELKIKELTLALEYQQKKQDEKEEQKALREQMREEAKLRREIEEARKSTEKEKNHYSNALAKAQHQLNNCTNDTERELIAEKLTELEVKLNQINKNLENIDYREANQRAGYVYVISNIGSFGENIYKIGMTRRLEPMERVDELGDASVPFNFDVHAIIFSEDAPKLEAALHNAFHDKKVNMVNTRREFFNVTLDEIERVVRFNYDKSVEFTRTASAQQYRESLKLKQ